MDHPNVTAYRRTADAFRVGDREALAALIDEDVVWHIPGSGPMAGDIHGHEALFRFFDRVRDVTEGTFMIKEHDVLGSDEHVVALSNWSAVREGIPVSVNVVASSTFGTVGSKSVGTTPRIWPPWIAYSAGPCDSLDQLLGGSGFLPWSLRPRGSQVTAWRRRTGIEPACQLSPAHRF